MIRNFGSEAGPFISGRFTTVANCGGVENKALMRSGMFLRAAGASHDTHKSFRDGRISVPMSESRAYLNQKVARERRNNTMERKAETWPIPGLPHLLLRWQGDENHLKPMKNHVPAEPMKATTALRRSEDPKFKKHYHYVA